MAKSSKFKIDWSKLPEVTQDKWGFWEVGDWSYDYDEESDLDLCEEAIYAHLAWYLFVKERKDGGTEA